MSNLRKTGDLTHVYTRHVRGVFVESETGMSNSFERSITGPACLCGKLADECEVQTMMTLVASANSLISAQDTALQTVKLMVSRVPDQADFTIRYEHPILEQLKVAMVRAEGAYYGHQKVIGNLS